MPSSTPRGEVDARFSSADAVAPDWSETEARLRDAELFWISTVRADGRPHVTPLPTVWLDGALHFATGAGEQKARNLEQNQQVVLTTGTNTWDKGYDLVVEGTAVRVADDGRLRVLARAWEDKYGPFWHYEVREGHFHHGAGSALVFAVAPDKVLGFGKGEPFSQTRWQF